jgi:sensor histidine kinase YesM
MEFSEELIRQAAAIIDWKAKDFEKLAFATTDDRRFKELLREFDAADGAQRFLLAYGLLDGVNRQAALNEFILSFAILSRSGKMLSRDKTSATFALDQPPTPGYPDMVGLHRAMTADGEKTAWRGMEGDPRRVLFIRQILDSDSFEDLGLFAAAIDSGYFDLAAMQEDSPLRAGTLIIADEKGRALFTNGAAGEDLASAAETIGTLASRDTARVTLGERAMGSGIVTKVKRWKVVCILPMEYLLRHADASRFAVLLVSLTALVLAVLLALGLSSGITKNIKALEKSMRTIERGDFSIRVVPHNLDEVGLLGLRFNIMADRIDELVNSVSKERMAKERMEYQALIAEINPHFLYNTLGSIKWLARKEGQKTIDSMITALIDLLRFSVNTASYTTVEEEVCYVSNYLVLQKHRYEDRFVFETRVDEEVARLKVPRFVLQPLAENALLHGIEFSKYNGTIHVRAVRSNGRLVLEVEDNGVGTAGKDVGKLLAETRKEHSGLNGIGIKNVHDRIRLSFGEPYGVSFAPAPVRGTLVRIELPLLARDPEESCTRS